MSSELPNLEPSNVDSLVILDEPLYIIDGIYYSENDLYGPNPTSPYAPLDKQEIKTITILQDLEATSKYGEKGKKGVVIITTKTGKPVNKK
jgi:TonB-dependent SusC/RagA subfamily outer membrane receptor